MAADQPLTKFGWGHLVHVISAAPAEWRPGNPADVCGVRTVDRNEVFGPMVTKRGTIIYTIEFGDGHTIEVPEEYLE